MSLYCLAKFYTEALPLTEKGNWGGLLRTIQAFADNAPYRGSFSALLRRRSSPQSAFFFKVWISTFPWELSEGLNQFPETSMGGLQLCPVALEDTKTFSWLSAFPPSTIEIPRAMLFFHPQGSTLQNPLHYWLYKVAFDLDLATYNAQGEVLSTKSFALTHRQRSEPALCPVGTRIVLETLNRILPSDQTSILLSNQEEDTDAKPSRLRVIPADRIPSRSSEFPQEHYMPQVNDLVSELLMRERIQKSILQPFSDFLIKKENLYQKTLMSKPKSFLKYRNAPQTYDIGENPSPPYFRAPLAVLNYLGFQVPS